jgi:hypothetical protein
MIFTGHDPGLHGAVATIDEDKHVLALDDVPLDPHGDVDGAAFAKLFPADAIVCIEENHSRSHEDKRCPGRRVVPASDYAFAYVSGRARGICDAKCIIPIMVSPQTWKRAMTSGMPADGTKDASMRVAKALFPSSVAMLYGKLGGALDGRAEALLLAAYCLRLWRTSNGRCVHRHGGTT